MASDPTLPPAEPAAGHHPAVAFVAAHRSAVGWALVALGVACLILAGVFFYRGSPSTPAGPDANAESAVEPLDKKPPVAAPYRTDYIWAGVAAVFGALAGVGVGGWLLAVLPRPTESERRSQARVAILLAGGLFGVVLMATGLLFAALWFGSLVKWLDQKTVSEAKWVLGPVLVFLFGGGLVFLAIQPARDEERNNPFLRRLVYGANFVLTTLLLVLLLLVGNVFAAIRVPNKLDTTQSGLYSLTLDAATRGYLTELKQTIDAYAILPAVSDDPVALDIHRLLDAAHDANPSRFVVHYLSPTANRKDIADLKNRYPQIVDRGLRSNGVEYGVLLTTQENEMRSGFIRVSDMVKNEPGGGPGQPGRRTFIGQAALARELLVLSEGDKQPTVYFTQSAGELSVVPEPGAEAQISRPASDLRAALEKVNYRTARLPIDARSTEVKVPDDADVVVVADPTRTLSDRTVKALREYMTKPRADKKTGRLLVLAGAHAAPPGSKTGLVQTGLEPLLTEFGIAVQDKMIYAEPTGQELYTPATMVVGFTSSAVQDNNPVALSFLRSPPLLRDCRPLTTSRTPPTTGVRATPLLATQPGITWLEPAPLPNPEKTWEDIIQSIQSRSMELAAKKSLSQNSRVVAAVAAQGDSGRVVVFGSGDGFSDEMTRVYRGRPIQAELFAACVNYLRERPPLANVAGKTYGEYPPPSKSVDRVRLIALPVGFALLAVLALGFGVWVFRRQ
jgi:hypothetical protein